MSKARAKTITPVAILAGAVAVMVGAAPAQAAKKWGTVIEGFDGAKLQGCQELSGGFGGLSLQRRLSDDEYSGWAIHLRLDNRSGSQAAVAEVKVIPGYWHGKRRVRLSDRWQVDPGQKDLEITGAILAKSRAGGDNEGLSFTLRRPDGSGSLTWVLAAQQLPRCGMSRQRVHWLDWTKSFTGPHNGHAAVQHCEALIGSGYGPLWRLTGRGNNSESDHAHTFFIQTSEGGNWSVTLEAGQVSEPTVQYASPIRGDKVWLFYDGVPGCQCGGDFPELKEKRGNVC